MFVSLFKHIIYLCVLVCIVCLLLQGMITFPDARFYYVLTHDSMYVDIGLETLDLKLCDLIPDLSRGPSWSFFNIYVTCLSCLVSLVYRLCFLFSFLSLLYLLEVLHDHLRQQRVVPEELLDRDLLAAVAAAADLAELTGWICKKIYIYIYNVCIYIYIYRYSYTYLHLSMYLSIYVSIYLSMYLSYIRGGPGRTRRSPGAPRRPSPSTGSWDVVFLFIVVLLCFNFRSLGYYGFLSCPWSLFTTGS